MLTDLEILFILGVLSILLLVAARKTDDLGDRMACYVGMFCGAMLLAYRVAEMLKILGPK